MSLELRRLDVLHVTPPILGLLYVSHMLARGHLRDPAKLESRAPNSKPSVDFAGLGACM